MADAVAVYFIHLLDGAGTIDERVVISRSFHDHGYHWLAALTNLDTIQRPVEGSDAEQRWRQREFAITTSAAIRGGQNVPQLVMAGATLGARPRLQLSLSNLQSARGKRVAARRAFELARAVVNSRPQPEKATLVPGLLRREAQISRSPVGARTALLAAESEYSENTALVFEGILAVSEGRFDLVEESLERLESRRSRISWLYHGETHFIRALYLIFMASKDLPAIYSSLCIAQYIYVVLGLQASIAPELALPSPDGQGKGSTPVDVLRSSFLSSRLAGLDSQECLGLRLVSLKETHLLEQLLDPIAGWREGPKPGPGHLTDRVAGAG
jgi:hypothetical protein